MNSTDALNIPILIREHLAAEITSLGEVGIRARRTQAFGELQVTELSAGGLDALLSLAKYDDVENLACGYITGPAGVELATRVVDRAHAVPAEILEVLATNAQDPEVRFGALKVAGQAHANPHEPGAGWDTEIAFTVAAAMRDEEPAIRLEAALVAVRVGAARAAPLLHALLGRETEQAVRTEVEGLIKEVGSPSTKVETTQSARRSARLAFPVLSTTKMEDDLRMLDAAAAAAPVNEVAQGVRLYEWRARSPQQARTRCLVDEPHGAACAYFDGDDAAALALEFAYVLHFVPIPVARAVARAGPTLELRVSAVLALQWLRQIECYPTAGGSARACAFLEALSADRGTHSKSRGCCSDSPRERRRASLRIVALTLKMGPDPVGRATEFSRAIFVEVEKYLDQTVEELDEEIFIPQVELNCVVSTKASSIAVAIAHAIGRAIAAAIREARASSHLPSAMGRQVDMVRSELSGNFCAGNDRVSGRSRYAAIASHRWDEQNRWTPTDAEPETSLENKATELAPWVEGHADPLEALARVARRGLLSELASDLDEGTLRRVLSRVRDRLRSRQSDGALALATTMADARLERAMTRAREIFAQCKIVPVSLSGSAHAQINLVLAIALLGRISSDYVACARSLVNAIDALLPPVIPHPDVPGNPDPSGSGKPPAEAMTWFDNRTGWREGETGLPGGLAVSQSFEGRAPMSQNGSHVAGVDETFAPALPVVHTSQAAILEHESCEAQTQIAGLAFLLGPLDDLGFSRALATIRLEPTIALHTVLRRILKVVAVDVPENDPATWLLAGLLDAPDDFDRADDAATWTADDCSAFARAAGVDVSGYASAIDAWAHAAVAETRARLKGTSLGDALGAEVIAVCGTLRLDDEQLTVTVPFTSAYEPLLRAGLLCDLSFVPWLDGRALRFVFQEDL